MRTVMKNFDKRQLLKAIIAKEKEGWECVSKVKKINTGSSHYLDAPVWMVVMQREDGTHERE